MITNSNNVPWHKVYPILAQELVRFYKDDKSDVPKSLYGKLLRNKDFLKLNPWINDNRKAFKSATIDPFQIFTSFNQPKQSSSEREQVVNILFRILHSKYRFEKIDFKGCPTPIAIRIRSPRPPEINRQIWEAFIFLFEERRRGLNQFRWEAINDWFGINVPSFTIFLFWTMPRFFIPLDKNTFRALQQAGITRTTPQSSREYIKLIPRQDVNFYIDIATNARFDRTSSEEYDDFINGIRRFYNSRRRGKSSGSQCRLVAIRTMPTLTLRLRKVIQKNELFRFYSLYQFNDDGTISYDPNVDLRLYDIDNTRIDITAIVGKNGSGKSALTELLVLAINNIASKQKNLNADYELQFQPGLHIEIYFHTDTLYRITCDGEDISITEYDFNGSIFGEGRRRRISAFDLSDFFYTVYINYSSYSLNSIESGRWLDPLFKKNDSYQVPIVLSPYREDGNFDINKENSFVKSRLLSNLLERVDKKEPENFRKLTDNDRYATHFTFGLRKKENNLVSGLNEEKKPEEISDEYLISQAMKYFDFSGKGFNEQFTKIGMEYITGKLRRIARNYPLIYSIYTDPKTGSIKRTKLRGFFRELRRDRSHITYKLRQAINYFKYNLYQRTKLNTKVSIELLSQKIVVVKSKFREYEKLRTIDLIPPPFFNTEILIENEQPFQFLSSGEKQKIYSVSSVVYHLNNLDSVEDGTSMITYRNVTILFDELELYYHPDMQRTFIDYFLRYLKRANFENIQSIQLCFVTHSPFILSDILDTNTLYLHKGAPVANALNGRQTFAGNIHDLLANSFFLTHGLMGLFAKRQIRSAVAYLAPEDDQEKDEKRNGKIKEEEEDEVKEILNEIKWDQASIFNFINCIGEPLLRESLLQLYAAKFIHNEAELEREIEQLRKNFQQRRL